MSCETTIAAGRFVGEDQLRVLEQMLEMVSEGIRSVTKGSGTLGEDGGRIIG